MKHIDRFIIIVFLILLIGCSSTTPQWQVKIGTRGDSKINAPVTVRNGLIYVPATEWVPGLHPLDTDNYLQALNVKDGDFIWHSSLGGPAATTPVINNGTVYIGSKGSGLYALDAKDGQLKWLFLAENPASDPVVNNGIVYLSIEGINKVDPDEPRDNKLVAIDSKTGELFWSTTLEKSFQPRLAPFVTATAIYFVNGPELYTADPQTGDKRLIFKSEQDFVTEPVLYDGDIYIGSYWEMVVIDADSEAVKWKFPIEEGFISSVLVSGNIAYLSTVIDLNPESAGRGKLFAVDLKKQSELWQFDFDGPIYSLIDDNDTVYFGSGPEVHGLDKATGKEVWQFEAGGTINAPVLADGMIYVGDWDGQLYAVPAAEKSQ